MPASGLSSDPLREGMPLDLAPQWLASAWQAP